MQRHNDDPDVEDDDDNMMEDEAPQAVEELAQAVVPDNLRHVRACKRCGILKSVGQFIDQGCENCDQFLHMADDPAQVNKCTTAFYEGQVAVMDPRDSWAAKWIRVEIICRASMPLL